jgi:PleD family two-component response regulator
VAERLLVTIERIVIENEQGPFGFTVSIRLSLLRGQDINLAWALTDADNLLYLAKKAGRNQVKNGVFNRELASSKIFIHD